MKSQLLNKLNKNATNYTVSRKAIGQCASEGYIFTSGKVELDPAFAALCARTLIEQQIVQSVEVYSASLSKCLEMKKVKLRAIGIELETSHYDFNCTDYFTTLDRQSDLAVVKITTFDMPEKHLKRIAQHCNCFEALCQYLRNIHIEALTYLYPDYKSDEDSAISSRLQFINNDQHEYRVMEIAINDKLSGYYNFEASIGKNNISKLVKTVDCDKSNKIEAIFSMDTKTSKGTIHYSDHLIEVCPACILWLQQDFTVKDSNSVFEINDNYVQMVVRLSDQDLLILQKLKTAELAIQYLCKNDTSLTHSVEI